MTAVDGCGLAANIASGQMVIEYAGEVISHHIADKREQRCILNTGGLIERIVECTLTACPFWFT